MDSVKSIFASRTFWGAFIALIAVLAKGFGMDIDSSAGDLTTGATDLITAISAGNWMAVVTTVAGIGGTIFAIYGRMRATKAIK